METYKYVISQIAHDNIYSFYSNVSKQFFRFFLKIESIKPSKPPKLLS